MTARRSLPTLSRFAGTTPLVTVTVAVEVTVLAYGEYGPEDDQHAEKDLQHSGRDGDPLEARAVGLAGRQWRHLPCSGTCNSPKAVVGVTSCCSKAGQCDQACEG